MIWQANRPMFPDSGTHGNKRYRIMVVEDNSAIAKAMQFALQRAGYDTKWCEDETVYQEIRDWKPDLILMDLRMPRLDGGVATAVIKSDPETQGIPVIIVTADQVTRERFEKTHANDLVNKPFRVPQLLERNGNWLRQRDSGLIIGMANA
jgi:CheY-like chemotaxis protein